MSSATHDCAVLYARQQRRLDTRRTNPRLASVHLTSPLALKERFRLGPGTSRRNHAASCDGTSRSSHLFSIVGHSVEYYCFKSHISILFSSI